MGKTDNIEYFVKRDEEFRHKSSEVITKMIPGINPVVADTIVNEIADIRVAMELEFTEDMGTDIKSICSESMTNNMKESED